MPRVEGGGQYLVLGELLNLGASLQLFRSDQVLTEDAFRGLAQAFSGGWGPVSASAWRNADGQLTYGAGPGWGLTFGGATYTTKTSTWSWQK